MISREDLVTQSVTRHVREQLLARGYPQEDWVLIEAFEGRRIQDVLKEGKQVIAAGFNFDGPPEAAEMGSDLTTRVYHLEFFVIGTSSTYARNLASVIKFAIDGAGEEFCLPLYDFGQPGAPEIDAMEVLQTTSRREPIPNPEPWQQYVWLVQSRVEDTYHASLV